MNESLQYSEFTGKTEQNCLNIQFSIDSFVEWFVDFQLTFVSLSACLMLHCYNEADGNLVY